MCITSRFHLNPMWHHRFVHTLCVKKLVQVTSQIGAEVAIESRLFTSPVVLHISQFQMERKFADNRIQKTQRSRGHISNNRKIST